MAKKDNEIGVDTDDFEVASYELDDFHIASISNRGPLVRTADDDSDEAEYLKQQRKDLKKIERSKESADEFKSIMDKINSEEARENRLIELKKRNERAQSRKMIGLDPFGKDDAGVEEFEIVPDEDDDDMDDIDDSPRVPELSVVDGPVEPKGKHAGGRPAGSTSEGLTDVETMQVPWAEDSLISLRSMLLTRQELLKEYGFSEKEMIRIFEEKPDKFMRDVVYKNLDKINNILTKNQEAAITKEEVSAMDSDDIDELLHQRLGTAGSKFFPEDLSPEWWRFLHGEVPVATESQKSKLSKLMADAVKAKATADIADIWIAGKLGLAAEGQDRKAETKRAEKILKEDLEEKFKKGLDGVETHFIEEKTGQGLREYLEKNDKLTDVDIFNMTKYYQTMLDHYTKLSEKLEQYKEGIAAGDFDEEEYVRGDKAPDILEQGETIGRESDAFDAIIGKSRSGAPYAE